MCPECEHTLVWYDLLPVVSWVSLGGKCRYCHQPISRQYPLVELVTALLFSLSYIYWPYAFNAEGTTLFVFWLVLLTGFVALAVYDLRWFLLPDKIILPLVIIVVVQVLVRVVLFSSGFVVPREALIGSLCLAGLFYILFQVSGGKWIGGGDVKSAVVLGGLTGGALQSALLLFISSLLGTFISLPLIWSQKLERRSQIPYGPFLLAATFIVYLFGNTIITWYKRQFLLL